MKHVRNFWKITELKWLVYIGRERERERERKEHGDRMGEDTWLNT
jgi:hypothetical protein